MSGIPTWSFLWHVPWVQSSPGSDRLAAPTGGGPANLQVRVVERSVRETETELEAWFDVRL